MSATTQGISGDFGDAVMVLMKSPGWRDLPLRDLERRLLRPMDLGQVLVLRQSGADGPVAVVGVVLVARVSDDVHDHLASGGDIDWDRFDWRSGDRPWLVAVETAPEAAAAVLASIKAQHFAEAELWARLRAKEGTRPVRLTADGTLDPA